MAANSKDPGMVNTGEAAQNAETAHNAEAAHNVATAQTMERKASVMAQTRMRSNQNVSHHRMVGTRFGAVGYEDHPPYDREDLVRPPYLRSHPLLVEPQAVSLEQESPYDRE